MKVYTKTGDNGTTARLTGKRYEKSDPFIDAYGEIDELNCWVGMLHSSLPSSFRHQEPFQEMQSQFNRIQSDLFHLGSHLACDDEKSLQILPTFDFSQSCSLLEQWIDRMSENLEPLRNFILPGGTPSASQAHVARAICRRVERKVVALDSDFHNLSGLTCYLNRLSDYFFVLARWLNHLQDAQDIHWKPND